MEKLNHGYSIPKSLNFPRLRKMSSDFGGQGNRRSSSLGCLVKALVNRFAGCGIFGGGGVAVEASVFEPVVV